MRISSRRFLIGLAFLATMASHACAQEGVVAAPPGPRTPQGFVEKSVRDVSRGKVGAAIRDDVKALRRGPLLMHGNYCGIGGRPGTQPIDALDEACMHHDACTKENKLPDCACNDRLRIAAAAIAGDPRTKPDVQAAASATAAAMAVLICKTGAGAAPTGAPAVPVEPAPPASH